MKLLQKAAAVIAMAATGVGGPASASDVFNSSTMLGWQRTTGPVAAAYFRLPFHGTTRDNARPRLGLAMTAPQRVDGGRPTYFTTAPRMFDLAISGDNFATPWAATLSMGNTVAWASDPSAVPASQQHLFDSGFSGISWVIVGAATVALGIGIFEIINDDVPPPVTGTTATK